MLLYIHITFKVDEEFRQIENVFSTRAQIYNGSQATPETVLAGLQVHPWAHFACHGSLNATEPFKSSFKLHGGDLSLLRIASARLPNAELAFLAACHSAAGESFHIADETLSLAAAIQFCGFRSIIGTLWTMRDEDWPTMARSFYEYMLRRRWENVDSRESAVALHSAVNEMRVRDVPIERWSTFVHIGV